MFLWPVSKLDKSNPHTNERSHAVYPPTILRNVYFETESARGRTFLNNVFVIAL